MATRIRKRTSRKHLQTGATERCPKCGKVIRAPSGKLKKQIEDLRVLNGGALMRGLKCLKPLRERVESAKIGWLKARAGYKEAEGALLRCKESDTGHVYDPKCPKCMSELRAEIASGRCAQLVAEHDAKRSAFIRAVEEYCRASEAHLLASAVIHRRAYEAGNLGALSRSLADALTRGSVLNWLKAATEGVLQPENAPDASVEVPRWALEGAIERLRQALPRVRIRGRGRNSTWGSRYEQDMVDYRRFRAVRQARTRGAKWTDGAIYEEAAGLLEDDTDVYSTEAIAASYKRVKRRLFTDLHRYLCTGDWKPD